jgi:hypothetical protein
MLQHVFRWVRHFIRCETINKLCNVLRFVVFFFCFRLWNEYMLLGVKTAHVLHYDLIQQCFVLYMGRSFSITVSHILKSTRRNDKERRLNVNRGMLNSSFVFQKKKQDRELLQNGLLYCIMISYTGIHGCIKQQNVKSI